MNTLLKILSRDQFGFVTKQDLEDLEANMPNLPVLLRFGCGRTVVQAYLVKNTIEATEAKGDYLRDVSIASQTLTEMGSSPFVPLVVKQAIESLRA